MEGQYSLYLVVVKVMDLVWPYILYTHRKLRSMFAEAGSAEARAFNIHV